jgi:predicted N-acetyltransferase YhbS
MQTRDSVVRRLRAEDIERVDAMIAAAFGRPGRPQPPPDAVPAGEIRYVVERDGAIAGFGGGRSYGAVGYVGPMAVDAAWRRRGVGLALLEALVLNLERLGCRSILLDATELGAPLYERFGFVDADRTDVYERDGGPFGPGSPSVDKADLERANLIDVRVAGCDRSAALDAFAREPSARLVVCEAGYVLAHRRVLGPWLATDRATARLLFETIVRECPHLEAVFVPASNHGAAPIVAAHGFRLVRSLRHMRYGAPSPMRRDCIFGQGSLGHG